MHSFLGHDIVTALFQTWYFHLPAAALVLFSKLF